MTIAVDLGRKATKRTTVWSRFTLLITASVSAQSDQFSLSTQRYLKRFKTHGSLIQAANTLIAHDGCSG